MFVLGSGLNYCARKVIVCCNLKIPGVKGGRRGLVVSASDCGEGGPRFESRSRHLFIFDKKDFNLANYLYARVTEWRTKKSIAQSGNGWMDARACTCTRARRHTVELTTRER